MFKYLELPTARFTFVIRLVWAKGGHTTHLYSLNQHRLTHYSTHSLVRHKALLRRWWWWFQFEMPMPKMMGLTAMGLPVMSILFSRSLEDCDYFCGHNFLSTFGSRYLILFFCRFHKFPKPNKTIHRYMCNPFDPFLISTKWNFFNLITSNEKKFFLKKSSHWKNKGT